MVTFLQNLHRWHWMSGPVRRNGRSRTRYLKIRVPPVGRAAFKLYISFFVSTYSARRRIAGKKGKSRHGLALPAALTETGERRALSRITVRSPETRVVLLEQGKHGVPFSILCDRPNRHIDRERRERRAEWYDEKRVGSEPNRPCIPDAASCPQKSGTGVTA